MSEQTANLCTTDACESLRARLAKYEDAEGNPISTIAEQARDIASKQATINGMNEAHWKVVQELAALKAQPDPWQASGADWCSSIHSNPDAKAWADFFVAVFPGQADKHELMIGWFANAMMAMHDHLKAQPSGLVLPELLERETGEYGDAFARGWKAYEREYKRLNSSPVSAGDTKRAAKSASLAKAASEAIDDMRALAMYDLQKAVYSANSKSNQTLDVDSDLWSAVAGVRVAYEKLARMGLPGMMKNHSPFSAGGVDERAAHRFLAYEPLRITMAQMLGAFKTAEKTKAQASAYELAVKFFGMTGGEKERGLHELQALAAALSAPSHGEQVLEVPDQALLSDVVMHLTDWLELHECECENGHVCGRGHVRATRDRVQELISKSQNPNTQEGGQ